MALRSIRRIAITLAVVGLIVLLMGTLWPAISIFVNYIFVVLVCAMAIIVGASYLPRRVIGIATRLCIAGIMLGILGMIQPFAFELFKPGFLLLLGSTALYTVLSYIPSPSSAAANPAVVEEMPVGLIPASAPQDVEAGGSI